MATLPTSVTTGTGNWIWPNQYGDMSWSAQISSSTQIDQHRFNADVTGNYVITVGGFIDSQLRVYNSSGTAITGAINNGGFGGSETVTLSLTAASWYYVDVAGVGTGTGIYTLSVNGPDLLRNTISLSSSNNAGSASGAVNNGGDIDYFAIVAPSGTTSLNLTVTPDASLNTWVELYDNAGNRLQQIINGGTGGPDTASNISVTAGLTYWVGVSSASSTQTGNYTVNLDFNPDTVQLPVLSISALSADKPEGTNQTTPFTFQVTRTGGDTSGTSTVHWAVDFNQSPAANAADFSGGIIPSGDLTWGPNDTAPKTVSVGVNGDQTYEGDLPEHFIVVLSGQTGATLGTTTANGNIQNDDPNTLDQNDQISEAQVLGAMTNDHSVSGTIDVGTDVDMFSFTVTAGQRIAFDLDRPSGSLNSYLRLFNAGGTELDFNDNGSAPNELFSTTDSWLEHTFSTGGTYYIGVSNSGNTSYSATAGTGDGIGSTGAYNLYASVTGGSGFTGISGSVSPFNFSIQRDDSPGQAISPTLRTWIVIHGRNGDPSDANIQAVADAIHQRLPSDQVLTLDWSEAAFSLPLDTTHEDWIPIVGHWARDALFNHGFVGSTLDLVGHSWGAYVAAQIAEEIGGVNTIVALDPAENGLGSWNPNDLGEIDFNRDSTFSWAFYSRDGVDGLFGNEETPTTADEAIVVRGSDHSAIVSLFAYMVDPDTGTGGVSQNFQLQRLLDHTSGPWIPNRFDINGNAANGRYEAVIYAASGGQSPQSIDYFSVSAPEIAVSGNGMNILDGDLSPSSTDGTDFGTMTQGATVDRVFTVSNTGTSTLTTSGLQLPSGFTVVEPLSSSITAGGSDTFTVRLDTSSTVTKSGQISFTNNDSDENPFNFSITGTVNQPPSLSVAASAAYTEGSAPVRLSPAATVSDDGASLASATVRISGGTFANDQDFLGVTTSGTNISQSYDTATETLTLSGTDTIAHYQQVLDSVTFQTHNHNPTDFGNHPTRSIDWTVNDGSASSTTQHTTLTITAVNDAPVANSASYAVPENGGIAVLADLLAHVNDVDSSRSALTVANTSDPTHGTLSSFQSDGSFTYTPFANYHGPDSFTYRASDGALSSNTATVSIIAKPPPGDFTGDATSDVLWRNDGGQVATWEMKGGQNPVGHDFGVVGTSWQMAGIGDLTGDGTSDVLWRSTSGQVAMWEMKGGQNPIGHDFGIVPTNWQMAGIGDATGDGTSDVLWRSSNGQVALWEMKGGQMPIGHDFGIVPINWQMVGIGDATGDGTSDVFWRSSNGQVAMWEMKDGQNPIGHDFGIVPTNWQMAGIGDVTGDGTSDVFWRSTSGQVAMWEMKDGHILAGHDFGIVPTNWKMAGIADVTGDGTSDVLWRSDNGQVAMWEMTGGHILTGHDFGIVGSNWHIFNDHMLV